MDARLGRAVSVGSKWLKSAPERLFWAIFKFRFISILNMRPVWNATKCIPLDSVGPTESSDISFVAFQNGRTPRQSSFGGVKMAQKRP